MTEVYPGGLLTGGRDGKITIFDRHLNKINSVRGEAGMVPCSEFYFALHFM